MQRLQGLDGQARETVTAEYAPWLVGAKGNAAETLRLREESRSALTAFERAAEQEKLRSKTPRPKQ